jgi:hypothetical protein
MTDEVQVGPETFRRIALRNLDRTDEARRTILEEHSAAFRWLTASLLAINAGGLLSLKDADLQTGVSLFAGALFLIGVLASLLIGVFSQRANQATLIHLTNVTNFWVETYEKEEFDAEAHEKLMAVSPMLLKRASKSRIAGWVSAICFAVAVILMGFGAYSNQPEISPAEAAVIQSEPESASAAVEAQDK